MGELQQLGNSTRSPLMENHNDLISPSSNYLQDGPSNGVANSPFTPFPFPYFPPGQTNSGDIQHTTPEMSFISDETRQQLDLQSEIAYLRAENTNLRNQALNTQRLEIQNMQLQQRVRELESRLSIVKGLFGPNPGGE
jgi:hypothetical protein